MKNRIYFYLIKLPFYYYLKFICTLCKYYIIIFIYVLSVNFVTFFLRKLIPCRNPLIAIEARFAVVS